MSDVKLITASPWMKFTVDVSRIHWKISIHVRQILWTFHLL